MTECCYVWHTLLTAVLSGSCFLDSFHEVRFTHRLIRDDSPILLLMAIDCWSGKLLNTHTHTYTHTHTHTHTVTQSENKLITHQSNYEEKFCPPHS